MLASLTELNPRQLAVLAGHVGALNGQREVQGLVDERLEHEGACPHCEYPLFAKWGYTPAGERRYRCKACLKSFTGLTGTPFSGIHDKDLLLDNAACMKESLSVRKTAEALGVHRNTAFRFRHLMMPVLATQQPGELPGAAEADEAFFRRSYKGLKTGMPRKSRKRGSPASKRGISTGTVLPSVPTAASIEAALAPAIPRGSHKLGPYHIQNVNVLKLRLKGAYAGSGGVVHEEPAGVLGMVPSFRPSAWCRKAAPAPAECVRHSNHQYDLVTEPKKRVTDKVTRRINRKRPSFWWSGVPSACAAMVEQVAPSRQSQI